MENQTDNGNFTGLEIAVIGMDGRFPQANSLPQFWHNLQNGVEAISFFSNEEVAAAGITPDLIQNPHYVKAGGILDDIERFDAAFFGFYPREAALIDPQHRIFLESAWTALEHAGYAPNSYEGLIGVYAGVSMNTYLLFHLYNNLSAIGSADVYPLAIGNDKDFLPTRVSYKLNLRGPSVNVQSACSTSLVAVHLACRGLLDYQCDIALAGGVSVTLPQKRGYLYQEGGIASPDGHCRAFDAQAQGTVGGSGVGIVVLKRLADALADNDTIHAIIKGSAVNNDGSAKIGYTAPSVDGQVEVIATAQALADVDPDTISYIETHGTGTSLGDPIEMSALTQVFREHTGQKQFCAIGSVKPNVGHLDAAAGVTGLIKTVLALQHRQIPPSINYERPNPHIDFANSPFYVNDKLADWPANNGEPRRAGVSSFGLGGTNAHVVLEEAPPAAPAGKSRPWQLLLLSAKTVSTLDTATHNLAGHLRQHPEQSLADVAYTYQVGRERFAYRRLLVCRDWEDSLAALEKPEPGRIVTTFEEAEERPVAFMFTGQGAQYPNMARELYETEPDFQQEVDHCCALLQPDLGFDLRPLLFPPAGEEETAAAKLQQTAVTQPALFVIEYALARLWQKWGIQPQAMIGHSIGEYVAACLAGVFTLADALALVTERGRLMQSLPGGSMLSVTLAEEEIRPYLTPHLALAAINAPNLCAVSGPHDAIDALADRLAAANISYRRLHTSHAFHSPMMEPILSPFTARAAQTRLNPPQIPFISNVTGTWITAAEATDPGYWAGHLRQTVRFAGGMGQLLQDPAWALLEVGPGHTLTSLARQHPACDRERIVLGSLRHPRNRQSDVAFLLNSLGKLWQAGARVDWAGFYAHEQRRRCPLPTYPFERQRYWVEMADQTKTTSTELRKNPNVNAWFYAPSWQRADLPAASVLGETARWLLFVDEDPPGQALADRLAQAGQSVTTVIPGRSFSQWGPDAYAINPQEPESYHALFWALRQANALPQKIGHLWSATACPEPLKAVAEPVEAAPERGFYSLLYLAQALDRVGNSRPIQIYVISTGVQEVTGDELLQPAKATLLGPCLVIPQEYPHLTCRSIDVQLPVPDTSAWQRLWDGLTAELLTNAPETAPTLAETAVAYRGRHRWVQTFTRQPVPDRPTPLRSGGHYLITGGLGRIGLTLATHLAKTVQAKLTLVDQFALPKETEWAHWLETHDEDETTSRKIRQAQAIKALGVELLICQADVADESQMRDLAAASETRFGPLQGVIHAAGLVDAAAIKTIPETQKADCERQFRAKVQGALILEKVLQDKPLDFCLLQSSLASVLGGLGFAAYAAANRFMDALVQRHNQTHPVPWMSVNWDGWQFGDESETAAATGITALAITPEEGTAVFQKLPGLAPLGQVILSTGDLSGRIAKWLTRETAVAEPETESGGLFPRPTLQTDFVAPRSRLEETIAGMWQTVLGLEEVGVWDDFFELGGHSLLATQLVSRLRDLFQVELPLRDLFENPTVAGLAELIEAGQAEAGERPSPAITPISRTGDLPLSSGQQRLWFLDQLEPGSPLYNNFAAICLSGALNVAALKQCLNEIVRRHEILRTTFTEVDGRPRQIIAPELTLPLPLDDLQTIPPARQEMAILEKALAAAGQPFDLTAGPLLRLHLLKLAPDEHVIFITMHHIISDGWSVGVLIQETAALYTAFANGAASPLPPLTIQYADYAAWQQAWLQNTAAEDGVAAQLDYWRQQLANPPVLELPTDRPRPAVQTANGANEWFNLPPELHKKLESLSQEMGATLFMTLTAVLQTLLHRYTGQEEICVGTPIANRSRSETENLIGFLLNTLVLRTDLSGNPTFRALLERVRDTALAAYDHQDLPFELLVERLHLERDMSRAPLFQIMFDLQEAPLPRLNLPGLTFSPLRVDGGTAKFDLALSMQVGPDGLSGYLNYNTDLFDAETIHRMLTHFQTLLESVCANPGQPIATLSILPEAELNTLLAEWNHTPALRADSASVVETAVSPHPYQSIPQLIETQAARTPDAIALLLDGQQLTYAELNARANQLARHLQQHGVSRNAIVGLLVERSLAAIIGLVAILKAGGTYLPLDPADPPERLAFKIEDAQPKLILTIDDLQGQSRRESTLTIEETSESTTNRKSKTCAEQSRSIVNLKSNWSKIAQHPTINLPISQSPNDLAYIIYTSGSTGKPKGVCISHEAIATHILDIQAHFELRPDDRVLQFAAYSFDQSIEQILATLVSGATLVLRGPEIWPTIDFSAVVARLGLTVVNLPPAYWSQWVRDYVEGDTPTLRTGAASVIEGAAPNPQLRLVIVGGDVLPAKTIRLWQQTPLASARLLNAYGPTETTITALTYEVPTPFTGSQTPIGRPIANRTIYILDRQMQPVPTGVPGELFIGGAGLAQGYLNRPDLTAEKFIDLRLSPLAESNRPLVLSEAEASSIVNHKFYKTGDLCRFLPDGNVEFLGRVDNQVKIRGFRIELGEIEAALKMHPAVGETAVIAREDEPGDKRLVAYLTTGQGETPSDNELRQFLNGKLPDYMIPAAFVTLDELPLTTSGKINRRALPAPQMNRPGLDGSYTPPRTPVEEELAQMWAALLKVDRVSIHDNFFVLGGHSLLGAQLVARLRAAFQVDLPLRRLFETPTIAGLAVLITEELAKETDDTELAALLAELETLPDEEVRDLLAE